MSCEKVWRPAEIYEELFVPALFQHWSGVVAGVAGIRSGHHVLDVACGTGVLARKASEIAGAEGSVVGLAPCATWMNMCFVSTGVLRAMLVKSSCVSLNGLLRHQR